MKYSGSNYEKKLLIVGAIAALAVSAVAYWQNSLLPEKLVIKRVSPKDELGEIPVERVELAIQRLSTVFDWKAPLRNNKPVPLNKSILLVLKNDQLYDLFVEQPQFRPPMTNDFLVKYDIPNLLNENVGDLDPDGDGFTNVEEFIGGTNPRDPNSKPPATQKLYLAERVTNDYILRLRSSTSPYQVSRLAPMPTNSQFVELDKEFGFDRGVVRFKALSFERKIVPDDRTGEKDVSEMKILDKVTGKEHTLVRDQDLNLAEYEAKFAFLLGGRQEFTVKKGETFQLPGTGETYQVLEVLEDTATISKVDSQGVLGPPMEVRSR